jgi:hypothetical protein
MSIVDDGIGEIICDGGESVLPVSLEEALAAAEAALAEAAELAGDPAKIPPSRTSSITTPRQPQPTSSQKKAISDATIPTVLKGVARASAADGTPIAEGEQDGPAQTGSTPASATDFDRFHGQASALLSELKTLREQAAAAHREGNRARREAEQPHVNAPPC